MAIDVIKAYGCRVIEGMDTDDIMREDASCLKSVFLGAEQWMYSHKPSKKTITLQCVAKYFEPNESYYRFNERSSCEYVKKGLGLTFRGCNCKYCLQECILRGYRIKPKKIVIADNYFS